MKYGEVAREAFERKFSTGKLKDEDFNNIKVQEGESLFSLLCRANLGISKSELRRIFKQGYCCNKKKSVIIY